MACTARVLAILQIIIGLLLLGISIADFAVYFVPFLNYNILGTAVGMWVLQVPYRLLSFNSSALFQTCVTGAVGIQATRKEPAFNKELCVNIFSCGSCISALGGLVGFVAGVIWQMWFALRGYQESVPAVIEDYSVTGIMICVTVIFIGMWVTCYFCCQLGTCCDSIPRSQASSGATVGFPIITDAGNGALHTVPVGTRDNEPQIVLLPDSGEIQNPPPYEAASSGYQIELVDMPPSYEEAARDEWRTYV